MAETSAAAELDAGSVHNERFNAFGQAVVLAGKYFDADQVASLDAVAVKTKGRLRHGTAHTVVAIAGATGSGKSSIVNRLAGRELSASSVRRPTTSATHAVVFGDDDAGPLLDWLDIPHRYVVTDEEAPGGDGALNGLILLDLPDHDSTAFEHRIEVDRLVELVDVLVWVTDPQKYADAALHLGYIQPLASHASVLRFVLNQVDRLDDGGAAVARDFARLVADDGIVGAEVLPVSAVTGVGFDAFGAELTRAIEARNASLLRAEADLADAVVALQMPVGPEQVSERTNERLIQGLADAAGSAAAADVAQRHHVRQGRLAMGWPFTRWLRRLARKPLTELPGPGRAGVGESRADLAIRDYAEDVAGEASAPWPTSLRTAAFDQRDPLLEDLRSIVGREAVAAGKRPAWWSLFAWLQRVLAATAVVGLGWLIAVAVLGGFFQFDTEPLLPPTPEADWIPLPSALLIGGVILGLVLGLLVRLPLGVGAARRGRAARKAIEAGVTSHARSRVIEPVTEVVGDQGEIARLLDVAVGNR